MGDGNTGSRVGTATIVAALMCTLVWGIAHAQAQGDIDRLFTEAKQLADKRKFGDAIAVAKRAVVLAGRHRPPALQNLSPVYD